MKVYHLNVVEPPLFYMSVRFQDRVYVWGLKELHPDNLMWVELGTRVDRAMRGLL